MYHSLNPRFDGAFLNFKDFFEPVKMACLNPRFDGAFLNSYTIQDDDGTVRLNPRFDGAFLNLKMFINVSAYHKS